MGTFTVALQVADPEGRHYETVEAMVDSGATYTALPGSILERLGVAPHSARSFVLADGSRVERGFGRTWMRLNGREDVSPVVFCDEGAQPLLGAVTLEIFSLGIDPVNGRLIPVDAFMMASAAGTCRSTESRIPATSTFSRRSMVRSQLRNGGGGEVEVWDDGPLVRGIVDARSGWDNAFRRMREHNDDSLVDQGHSATTQWELTDWEW